MAEENTPIERKEAKQEKGEGSGGKA